MLIPKDILKATMAGLAMTLTVACDKEPLQTDPLLDDTCTETCTEEGCTNPVKHQGKALSNDPYYCPPCGMG